MQGAGLRPILKSWCLTGGLQIYTSPCVFTRACVISPQGGGRRPHHILKDDVALQKGAQGSQCEILAINSSSRPSRKCKLGETRSRWLSSSPWPFREQRVLGSEQTRTWLKITNTDWLGASTKHLYMDLVHLLRKEITHNMQQRASLFVHIKGRKAKHF